MRLLAFGINHHTAPIVIREKAAFPTDHLAQALHDMTQKGAAGEATILSTCNRTEIYCRLPSANDDQVIEWFCHYHRLPFEDIRPYLYRHPDQDAVKHAFRVASGLDSMVLGEPQILGQMKEAFAVAHKTGSTGKLLNRLFQQTFAVAKQIRTDTSIGANAVSVASAAVLLAKQIFDDLNNKTVLFMGAGDMIELCARRMREQNVEHMIVANRTLERAERLAKPFAAEAISLAEMPARLADADIVITSTASQLPILGKGAVERAIKSRKHRPIFMLDLAVPRDVESEVGELDDAYLYTIDDLKEVVDENLATREAAAREAEKIIDLRVSDFMDWVKSLDAVPTIRALREAAETTRDVEIQRALRRLRRGEDPEKVLTLLARDLTNKFTHAPSDTLKQADDDGNDALLEAARRLFNLNDH